MTAKTRGFTRRLAAAAGLSIALGLAAAPDAVLAQGQTATVNRSATVTGKVTIKSINAATRHIVVTNAAGENVSMKVPPDVKNFGQLKVGDTINATYFLDVAFVIAPRGTKLPPDSDKIVAAQAAKGGLPAAAVANRIVVTGAVVGMDKAKHTLRIVSPQGGQVHNVQVTSADGIAAMNKIKIGDTITAHVTESLLIAARPA